MNLLLYSKAFLPAIGGLERNTLTAFNTLKCLGLEVTILTETLTKQKDEENVIRSSKISDFKVLLKKHDLLIINGGIALRILIPCYLYGKKFIVIYQNATLYNQNSNVNLKAKAENIIRRFFAKKALANICLTNISLSQLNIQHKNSFVLYNPIDSELEEINQSYSVNSAEDKKIDCLFVGRIIEGKGVFLLMEALILLSERGYRLNCTFVGEGKDLGKLKKSCSATNLKIDFAGKLDGEELLRAYHHSKLLIIPSSSHIEGNPLVIAEAISCGLPVIGSNQPSISEAIFNCGLTFNSGDALDLSKKIEQLITNKELYQSLTYNTLTHREKFSMKTYKKTWKTILSSIKLLDENKF